MKVWINVHRTAIIVGYVVVMTTLTAILQILESTGKLP